MVKRRDRDGGGDSSGPRTAKKSRSTTDGSTVFVGNLNFKTSWQNLKDHMRKAGNVESANILQAKGGSKGCALVTFQNPKEAQRAIKELDGTKLEGREITVQSDQREGTRDPPGRQSNDVEAAGGGGSSVFVGNIPFDATWKDLRELFQRFGRIDHADIAEGPNGKSKGYGTIQFVHAEDAKEAMKKMDGKDYKGRPLQVKPDKKAVNLPAKVKAAPAAQQGGTQLFVGNLDYDVTWKQLKELFQNKCTGVEHADVVEGPNGRKKGFGTVSFATEGDARRAISKMNGFTFEGRKLEVRLDKNSKAAEKKPASKVETKAGTQLYVGNVSFESSSEDVLAYFRSCGKVEDAQVMEGKNGFKKGFAIVKYAQAKDAERAIQQLDGKEFMGRELQVRWDKSPDFKPSADTKPSAKPAKSVKKEVKEEPFDETVALDTALKAAR